MNHETARRNPLVPHFPELRALAYGSVGAALIVALTHGCARHTTEPSPEEPKARTGKAASRDGAAASLDSLGLNNVARDAMPAVVSVATTRAVEGETPGMPFDDPLFRRFFGERGPFGFSQPQPKMEPQRGLGSGVIVGKDVILTNAHVVEGADSVVVTAQNRRELSVEVAGVDEKSDLAVLRIKNPPSDLKHLEFADSDQAQLGQVVLAVGNPFGVGETVTMGIVSAKGRADLGIADYEDFIQTDAAINPGNSGGALVDLEGRLLGIPTAILSRSGGYMGVGFAIPSNMAQPIMKSLLETGKVARSYLGVTIQNVDEALAKALGLGNARGVLISDVVSGGPADKAGLRRGDVVLSIAGKPVSTSGQLRNAVSTAGVGKTVEVEILRKGAHQKLDVTLAALPAEKGEAAAAGEKTTEAGSLGIEIAPLDANLRERLQVPPHIQGGVVVADVKSGSAAAEAGIRQGDVIVELDGKPVKSGAQLKQLWQASKGSVAILLLRDGRTFYVAAKH